jgi:farnesyl diphosphate synthase
LPVFDFNHWTAHQLGRVEMALSSWVTADSPADLGHPMRYAVLDGGKRLRPLLVLAAAETGTPLTPPPRWKRPPAPRVRWN